MTFGDKLREIMTQSNLSLRRLARQTSYDLGYLSKVANGRKPPSAELAQALDDALDAHGELVALGPRRALWRPPNAPNDSFAPVFTPDDEERLLQAARRPVRVDRSVLDALTTVLSAQRRLEDAIGPASLVAPVGAQLEQITEMLSDTRGPHRDPLGRIVAEWTVYAGWLLSAVGRYDRALELFFRAEELADDVSDGTIAQIATSFRGYVARRQGRHRAVVRASCAALATPGGHPSQRVFDTLQLAQGYAGLGQEERARRLLDDAAEHASHPGEPPPPIYWYSEPFFRLNIGMVLGDLGQYKDAADILSAGIEAIPPDQREAKWMAEYKKALTAAQERA